MELSAPFKTHGSDSTPKGSKPAPFAGRLDGSSGLKETVSEHQQGNERQKEDGVDGVALAVSCRHRVSRRFENKSANRRDHHAEEHYGGGIVRKNVIHSARRAGQAGDHQVIGVSEVNQREGAGCEENESCENEDMKKTRGFVTGMLPLAQPISQKLSQPQPRAIKAPVAFRMQERRQALHHDIAKTGKTQDMDRYVQGIA